MTVPFRRRRLPVQQQEQAPNTAEVSFGGEVLTFNGEPVTFNGG